MRASSLFSALSSFGLLAAAPLAERASRFQWFGVDESGAEFGQTTIPGTWGKDFTFPADSTIDASPYSICWLMTLTNEGFNVFRLPFLMERMVPNTLYGSANSAYLANYTSIVNYITNRGAWAIVDPHKHGLPSPLLRKLLMSKSYGRYYNNIITDTSGFQTFWRTVASHFAGNSRVIFDTNNEYHDMDQTLVLSLNQAAINGIRSAGANSQYIFVEGNSYSGAWTWTAVNDNLKALTDPQNKIVYEMHQYLDSDNSGTSATCVNSTIGYSRITSATQWLKTNRKIGIIGEFAGGANDVCKTAVTGMLAYMAQNTDVWKGALWWGGGPWWGNYIYSFEPPSGIAYTYYLSTLQSLM